MQAESGGNSRLIYHESFGIDSVGIYQVSYEDAFRYQCPFKTKEDLFNDKLNTQCKDLIAAKLIAQGGNWSQALGKYWSTLRSPEAWPDARRKPFEDFKKYAAQRGCKL